MGVLRKWFGKDSTAKSEMTNLADKVLDKVEAFLEAGEYLATSKTFDAEEFEKLDRILQKAQADYGLGRRQQMLSTYQQVIGGNEELRVKLAEEVAVATKDALRLLQGLPLTSENKKRIEKNLRKLRR